MTRSEIMRRNVGNHLVPEETLAGMLHLYELAALADRNPSWLPGSPDVVFDLPSARLAVFVHGCYWHGCPRHWRPPITNAKFWRKKIRDNKARDRRVARELRKMGFSVMVVWEHQVRDGKVPAAARVKRRLDKLRLASATSQWRLDPKEKKRLLKLREEKRKAVVRKLQSGEWERELERRRSAAKRRLNLGT